MKSVVVAGVVIMSLVAACGGGSGPTASPVLETTAVAPTPEAISTAEAAPVTVEAGTIAFEVSGDLTLVVNPGRAEYHYLDSVRRQQLILSDLEGRYLLLFILPDMPQTGVHMLEVSGREFTDEGVYTAAFTHVLADESQMFKTEVTGTITLETVGDRLTGSFQFTARSPAGQQITVSGTFKGIPVVFG